MAVTDLVADAGVVVAASKHVRSRGGGPAFSRWGGGSGASMLMLPDLIRGGSRSFL